MTLFSSEMTDLPMHFIRITLFTSELANNKHPKLHNLPQNYVFHLKIALCELEFTKKHLRIT